VAAKINQWTLLIAMIPLVFALTHAIEGRGGFAIRFDYQQRVEILLTAAQGAFAAAAMFKFRFLRWEAYTLLGLWAFQLFDPLIDPFLQGLPSIFGGVFNAAGQPGIDKIIVREYTSVLFLALVVYELVRYRGEFLLFRYLGEVWRTHIRPRAPAASA
jgi:hypothetical protein